MIKTIIFDIGGVIVDDSRGRPSIYKELSKLLKTDIEEIKKKVDTLILSSNKKVGDEFWKTATSVFKTRISEKEIKKAWLKGFGRLMSKIDHDVLKIAKKLKQSGYQVALLSNTIPPHELCVKESYEISQRYNNLFFPIILSYEVGSRKPSKKIFEILLKRINRPSNECIIIDDAKRNLETARKLGMKTILFKNVRQLKKDLSKFGVVIE